MSRSKRENKLNPILSSALEIISTELSPYKNPDSGDVAFEKIERVAKEKKVNLEELLLSIDKTITLADKIMRSSVKVQKSEQLKNIYNLQKNALLSVRAEIEEKILYQWLESKHEKKEESTSKVREPSIDYKNQLINVRIEQQIPAIGELIDRLLFLTDQHPESFDISDLDPDATDEFLEKYDQLKKFSSMAEVCSRAEESKETQTIKCKLYSLLAWVPDFEPINEAIIKAKAQNDTRPYYDI